MNSSMSGWSTLRITIFAARRVLPPDLMVPATESAPRMKDTGPEARPPADTCSFELRRRERLMPEPEPPLKMRPSVLYQSRIESMESSMLRMKQAEHWGCSSMPMLNHTGELKQRYWLTSRYFSSWRNVSAWSCEVK